LISKNKINAIIIKTIKFIGQSNSTSREGEIFL